MKASELMIGDWVGRVYDDRRIIEDYRQVDWIRTGEIGMRYQKVWSIGCIEPIPLTAEILEKNGWEAFNGTYNIVRYRIITKVMALIIEPMKVESILGERWFWLSVNKIDGEVRPNMNYPFCYVHELQHALRLCGLNGLADNFIV